MAAFFGHAAHGLRPNGRADRKMRPRRRAAKNDFTNRQNIFQIIVLCYLGNGMGPNGRGGVSVSVGGK